MFKEQYMADRALWLTSALKGIEKEVAYIPDGNDKIHLIEVIGYLKYQLKHEYEQRKQETIND